MKKRYLLLLILSLWLVSLTNCAKSAPSPEPTPPAPVPSTTPAPLPPSTQPAEPEYEIKTSPSGEKYIVDPAKIMGGGPPKDGIPSIDNPKFVSLEEADEWIGDNELVLGIIYKDIKRVYPMQIMVWHEIVNDIIAGDPLLITY